MMWHITDTPTNIIKDSLLVKDAGICSHQVCLVANILLVSISKRRKITSNNTGVDKGSLII